VLVCLSVCRADCQEQTKGFHGARYKKFNTEAEAQDFINGVKPKSKQDIADSDSSEESKKSGDKKSTIFTYQK